MPAGIVITMTIIFTLLGMWFMATWKHKNDQEQGQWKNFIKYWQRKVTTTAWVFPAMIVIVAIITALCVGG